MRTQLGMLRLILTVALLLPVLSHAATAGSGIEAIRGKQYGLTKSHGPWMVMVASFNELPPEQRKAGMTPTEAADELVYELRSRGMPAYTFSMSDEIGRVETQDRTGTVDTRIYAARRGSICVLAGNYSGPDQEKAVKSLEWLKTLRPKFLSGGTADAGGAITLANGGVFRLKPGTAERNRRQAPLGPLGGAFLTVNPLLSPEEVGHRTYDPLLLRLNAGKQFSLYDNTGKFTIVVASFYGKSITQVSGTKYANASDEFKLSDSLDTAGEDAWQLCKHLRLERKFDAFLWHDHHQSLVTIGEFESRDDPRIPQVMAFYGAKLRTNPAGGGQALTAEFITEPTNPSPGDPIRKTWIFDPQPELIPVPRIE